MWDWGSQTSQMPDERGSGWTSLFHTAPLSGSCCILLKGSPGQFTCRWNSCLPGALTAALAALARLHHASPSQGLPYRDVTVAPCPASYTFPESLVPLSWPCLWLLHCTFLWKQHLTGDTPGSVASRNWACTCLKPSCFAIYSTSN